MATVNYVREHERFIEYASNEGLSANEMLLWYGLMHVFNQRAEGFEWPDGFIRIKNDRLLTYLPFGWDALARARNRLKQRGLIDYRNGNRNTDVPSYKMIYFYPQCYPFKTDKSADNIGDNIGGKSADNIRDNMGDIYTININKDETYTQTEDLNDDHEEDDVIPRARTREWTAAGPEPEPDPIFDRKAREEAVRKSYAMNIGRMPYPAEVEKLVAGSWVARMSADMVARAIQVAGQNGAAKPAAYALSVMDEWGHAEVRQPHQIAEHQIEVDTARGSNMILLGDGDVIARIGAEEEAIARRRRENELAGKMVVP